MPLPQGFAHDIVILECKCGQARFSKQVERHLQIARLLREQSLREHGRAGKGIIVSPVDEHSPAQMGQRLLGVIHSRLGQTELQLHERTKPMIRRCDVPLLEDTDQLARQAIVLRERAKEFIPTADGERGRADCVG